MKPDYTANSRRRGANLTPDKHAWQDQAACIDKLDVFEAAAIELDTKGGARKDRDVAAAKAICQQCPSRTDCLTAALNIEVGKGGRWSAQGGLTPAERHALARQQAVAA